MAELDIIIPVYHEGASIARVLDRFHENIRTPFRVFICYDFDDDNTLVALSGYPKGRVDVVLVKNPDPGPHGAVLAGFAASGAPMVMVYMADDDYNVPLVDAMVAKLGEGYDTVVASRFVPGGTMIGCRWYKALPTRVATFTLHHLGRLGVRDSTNSFRLTTRRVIETIEIESREGFTFGIELLVKTRRLGWKIAEIPAHWEERADKPSRFRILKWMPAYLRWYFYAFATTYLLRGPETVLRRLPPPGAAGRDHDT